MTNTAEKPRVVHVIAAARRPASQTRGARLPRFPRSLNAAAAASLTTTSARRTSTMGRRALTANERGKLERRAGGLDVCGRSSQRRGQRVSRCAWRGNAGRHRRAAIRCCGAARVPHPSIVWCRCPGSTRSIALLGSVGARSLSIVRGAFFGGEATSGLATSAGWATMMRLTRRCRRIALRATAERQDRWAVAMEPDECR